MRSFGFKCATVFVAMVVLDVVFAMYTLRVAERDVLEASFWAATIQLANAFVVVAYVKDRRMAIPCALGAFVGTYFALRLL